MEQKGSQNLLSFVVLLAVIGATTVTGLLLARTMRATDRINAKTKNIARTGQGINSATDSVIQLSRTNELAASILASTQPLAGDLTAMVEQAKALDGLSGSLDASTGAINATVAQLLATANGMNNSLETARMVASNARRPSSVAVTSRTTTSSMPSWL